MDKQVIYDLISDLWRAFPYAFKLIRQGWPKESSNTLSIYQYELLGILLDCDSMTMTEIGSILAIHKSNITPIIDKLVSADMVHRFTDENDRRIVRIAITEKGRAILNEGREKMMQRLENLFGVLDDSDINKLKSSFRSIYEILSRIESKEV
jgi:DNA-binding MarR family transcriptional regulator